MRAAPIESCKWVLSIRATLVRNGDLQSAADTLETNVFLLPFSGPPQQHPLSFVIRTPGGDVLRIIRIMRIIRMTRSTQPRSDQQIIIRLWHRARSSVHCRSKHVPPTRFSQDRYGLGQSFPQHELCVTVASLHLSLIHI